MFALRDPPPEAVTLGGSTYRLVRVFKHDFFAATCLYEAAGEAEIPTVVVKFGRTQPFCGLPMDWYGRLLCKHERGIYEALAGVEGVPRWAGCVSETTYAVEYIDAVPLDHLDAPPAGFFDRLLAVFEAIHERGVAYGDANKRSNILVDAAGRPFVIDYQIALRYRDDWPWPARQVLAAAVRYAQRGDVYHLYKHKRRLSPHELTDAEEAASRRRGLLHTIHRKLTKPWRSFRRRFLQRQYESGRLESPTADLEDHDQPEKATWRKK
jgi:hypothetical protein